MVVVKGWLDFYFWRKKNWTNGAGYVKARVFLFSADQQLLCYTLLSRERKVEIMGRPNLEIQLMSSGNIWIYVCHRENEVLDIFSCKASSHVEDK